MEPAAMKPKAYTDLVTAVAKTKGTNIHVGAENVHFEKSGAFTGEISADMLVDLGVEYVIVGHSERRQYFAETDQTVNKRALAALNAGLKVIICVGESLHPGNNRCVPACANSPYCVHNACNSGRFAAHSRSAFSG